MGPAAVALTIQGTWVFGALINNQWSFAGNDKRGRVNPLLLQPFVNYNLPGGWYLTSSPVLTANWAADRGGDTWTVPLGAGAGKQAIADRSQWEFAACGGLAGAEFVWGDELTPNGKYMANTWQGEFPWQNLRTDGFEGIAPVGSFPPNGYGLYHMAGNVWEWTTDWYQHGKITHSCCGAINPRGAEREQATILTFQT